MTYGQRRFHPLNCGRCTTRWRRIKEHLKGFVSKRDDGALTGPFAPMLRYPDFCDGAWAYTKALIDYAKPPKPAHETAILATGAALNARYKLRARPGRVEKRSAFHRATVQ